MNAKPDIDEAAGIITEAGMRQIHAELAHWATYFLAIAEAMKLKKIPQLTDQNAKTLMRSIGYIRGAAKQARFAFDAAQIQGSQEAVQKAIPVALDFSTLLEDIRAGRVSREAALARIAELQAQIRQAEDPLPYGPIQLEGQPPPDSGKP